MLEQRSAPCWSSMGAAQIIWMSCATNVVVAGLSSHQLRELMPAYFEHAACATSATADDSSADGLATSWSVALMVVSAYWLLPFLGTIRAGSACMLDQANYLPNLRDIRPAGADTRARAPSAWDLIGDGDAPTPSERARRRGQAGVGKGAGAARAAAGAAQGGAAGAAATAKEREAGEKGGEAARAARPRVGTIRMPFPQRKVAIYEYLATPYS